MNRKDCERIGYILAVYPVSESAREAFFAMDGRIRHDYAIFSESTEKDEAVNDLFNELMTEKYGDKWPLLKEENRPDWRDIYQHALKTVHGDDYHPIRRSSKTGSCARP